MIPDFYLKTNASQICIYKPRPAFISEKCTCSK
jgi:hypothetical protein